MEKKKPHFKKIKLEAVDTNKKNEVDDESPPKFDLSSVVLLPPKKISGKKVGEKDIFALPSKGNLFSKASFSDLNLHPKLIQMISEELKLSEITSIQQHAIPQVLLHKDVLIKAPTGSGKTLCYLLPIIHMLLTEVEPVKKITREDGTLCCIVSPTHELSHQIEEILKIVQKRIPYLICTSIYGGEKRKAEKARLRKGVNILVATPGRLLDHLQNTQTFNLTQLRWLVFDEADRLLDMGFEKDITSILQILRDRHSKPVPISHAPISSKNFQNPHISDQKQKRKEEKLKKKKQNEEEEEEEKEEKKEETKSPFQTLLVSATVDTAVEQLIRVSLRDPILVGPLGLEDLEVPREPSFVAPRQLAQFFVQTRSEDRLVALIAFLRLKISFSTNSKALIFLSTCDSVEYHHALFESFQLLQSDSLNSNSKNQPILKVPIFKLHGNLSQLSRTKNFDGFAQSESAILLCTDVAARGMDFQNLTWIVQYDPPEEPKEYIHRIGRTARIGKTGQAVLFLLPSEIGYVEMMKESGVSIEEIKVSNILSTLEVQAEGLSGPRALQWLLEGHLLRESELLSLARRAFLAFMRSYQTHQKDTRSIFDAEKLHIGHVAKSFALRESPSTAARKERQKDYVPPKKAKKTVTKLVSKFNASSEFDAF